MTKRELEKILKKSKHIKELPLAEQQKYLKKIGLLDKYGNVAKPYHGIVEYNAVAQE
jgi:hypothetical protein